MKQLITLQQKQEIKKNQQQKSRISNNSYNKQSINQITYLITNSFNILIYSQYQQLNNIMQSSKQQQHNKKQLLLNNYIDQLLNIQLQINNNNHSSKSFTNISTPVPLSNMKTKTSKHKYQLNLMELFDLLIWTQKKKPQLLLNILQMDIISLTVQIVPSQQMPTQIKSFILLINNCKPNGQIIMYLLANKLIDEIIYNYLIAIGYKGKQNNHALDQQLQYLGSLLKACNNHLNQKTYLYFLNQKKIFNQLKNTKSTNSIPSKKQLKPQKIFDSSDIFNTYDEMLVANSKKSIEPQKQKQCLLLKVCTRFYNCPQQLTKTTVMNIFMSVSRQSFAKQLIINPKTGNPYDYITQWSHNLCCQFRNQLKNFNQQLMVLQQSQQDFYIQQLSDKIILWQDLTQTQFSFIYKQAFMHLVIYSLIIGSLNTYSLPMFNIKFTFYILAKMMKVCSNLDLIQDIGSLLFLKNQLKYSEHWVSTAVLKGFDLQQILNDNYYCIESKQDEQVNEFSGVNEFFFNMLKSKDQHFLHISSNMIHQLLSSARKNQNTLQSFNYKLGFSSNGSTLVKITSILIGQLRFDHSLNNLKRICQTLIYLHPSKHLSEENCNQFIFFYAQYLNETLDLLEKGSKYWVDIIQTFQYDMKILQMAKFNHKVLKDKQLLIHPSQRVVQQNTNDKKQFLIINDNSLYQRNTFSSQIPETPGQILRYRIAKTFLFLKFNELMVSSDESSRIITNYVQKLRIWQQKQVKPGQIINYPLKQKFHQIKIVQDKTQIPCVLIEDDGYLIIGFIEANHVKVIVNAKLKHITSEIYTRKDKTYIKLNISKFDFNHQRIVPKSTILLRGFSTGIQYFAVKKQNFKEKQLNSIRKGLKRTVQNLPQISLL